MRSLVRGNLGWCDHDLPEDFPYTVFDQLHSWFVPDGYDKPYNVVAGMMGADVLLAFDLKMGSGRNTARTTVVARRSSRRRPLPVGHRRYTLMERGEWRIVAHRHTFWEGSDLLDVETIRLIWEALE